MDIISQQLTALGQNNSNKNPSSVVGNGQYSRSLHAARMLQSNAATNEVNVTALEKGDVFKGEITNLTEHTVTVSLGNQQTLQAVLTDGVQLNIGNQLYFEVKENDGETIVLRPLTDEKFSPQNQTIEKALQSAGLQLNEKNMSVVKELMDASMPIDRQTIMKVLQQTVNHPEANLKTLINMIRCNVPITNQSVEQFESYMNRSNQLSKEITNITNGISDSFASVIDFDGKTTDLLKLNDLWVNTFATSNQTASQEVMVKPLSLAQIFDVPVEQNNIKMESLEGVQEALSNAKENPVAVDQNGKSSIDFIVGKEELLPEEKVANLVASEGKMMEEESALPQKLNEKQEAFANVLQKLGISKEALGVMLDPKNSAQDLLGAIKDFLKFSGLPQDKMKEFLCSKEYQSVLEQVIKHQWQLTPEQMKDPKMVDELYNRMYEQSEKLFQGAMEFGNSQQNLAHHGQQMKENLEFMQMLNEQYGYAQVPVSLSYQDVNSELFVYTNKKALEKNKNDISVLLHLDMEHLGATDVHVSLHHQQVVARFYLEDEKSVKITSQHMEQLQQALNKLGYQLEMEVVKREGKTQQIENGVEDFLAKGQPSSTTVKRYTFDMRA